MLTPLSNSYHCERSPTPRSRQAQDFGQESGRCLAVARPHDGVIEINGHAGLYTFVRRSYRDANSLDERVASLCISTVCFEITAMEMNESCLRSGLIAVIPQSH